MLRNEKLIILIKTMSILHDIAFDQVVPHGKPAIDLGIYILYIYGMRSCDINQKSEILILR